MKQRKMSLKPKKEKRQLPGKENANSRRPWPALPQQLLRLISRDSTLMQRVSYGGVSKSWRAVPRRCNSKRLSLLPQLSDYGDDGSYNDKGHPNSFNILFYQGYIWWYSRKPYCTPPICQNYYPLTHFVGYSHGVLSARRPRHSEFFLWNPISRTQWCCPQWDANIPLKFIALSSSPYDPSCIVLALTGTCSPAFLFFRMRTGKREWIKQDCNVIDPCDSDQQVMRITNAVGFKGKFYALSLQGILAVLEDVDSELRITAVSPSRAVPSVLSRHFREYLVESDGEILLVFLISKRSINLVDGVEVFRLEFQRLAWVKMESLGDRTLFAGAKCFISVTASKVGCRRNCVYFTHGSDDGWWVYDMGRSSGDSITKSSIWDEKTLEAKSILVHV